MVKSVAAKPSVTARPCVHCGGTGWNDPIGTLARYNAQRDAFKKAHPRLHCPACRKRCSPDYDSIDAPGDGETVTMRCPHCEHTWEEPRG